MQVFCFYFLNYRNSHLIVKSIFDKAINFTKQKNPELLLDCLEIYVRENYITM